MELQTNQSLENQITAILKARPEILQPLIEEYVEDLLFGKILEQSDSGEYMSVKELKKALYEDAGRQELS